jgi:hypothetical protein
MKVKGFSDVGWGEKSRFKKEKKFFHKKARHERGMEPRARHFKEGKDQTISRPNFKPKGNFVKKGAPQGGC